MQSPNAVHPSRWASTALSHPADLLQGELKALGAHVALCNGSRSPWFNLHCAAEATHSFLAPRFMTTLIVVTIAFGVSTLML